MQRPSSILFALVLGGLLAFWLLRQSHHGDATNQGGLSAGDAAPHSQSTAGAAASRPAMAAVQPAAFPAPAAGAAPPDIITDRTGVRYRRAYLLSLESGALSLMQAQDIEGDFAPSSPGMSDESFPGQLRCQLVTQAGQVLAEEITPAPTEICQVLDRRVSPDKPLAFVPPGGPLMFQVRLPRVAGASKLNIYRTSGTNTPANDPLVGSISLTAR